MAYPNNGFALALRTVAGAIVRGVGTRVFWVQTGGYDTHAGQGAAGGGAYANLMGTFGDGLLAFYNDLRNQGLLNDTLVLQFSEFGRRISENGSGGTDHGAARGDDGDGRRGARRHLRHGRLARPVAVEPDAREQRRRRAATKPISGPSTPKCSTAGWAPTRPPFWAAISGRARRPSCDRPAAIQPPGGAVVPLGPW